MKIKVKTIKRIFAFIISIIIGIISGLITYGIIFKANGDVIGAMFFGFLAYVTIAMVVYGIAE